jgi:hypothetical protein
MPRRDEYSASDEDLGALRNGNRLRVSSPHRKKYVIE